MEVALAILADYANVSREGKLNIMGIFDQIKTQSVPAMHPQMQLIMTFEGERHEANKEHKVEVELIDENGAKLISIGGDLKFGLPPFGEKIRTNHIIQLNNIKIDHFGKYDFKILIDNEVLKSISLTVSEAKKEQGQ